MVVDYVQNRQVVPDSDFIVIYIMSRSNLEASCSEIHGHIIILDNRYLLINQRNKHLLTFEPVISFICRVYTDCSIGHDCLRTGCGNDDVLVGRIAVAVRNKISQMIEFADGIPVDDLLVADCGKAYRIPVDHSYTSIYIAFVVEIYKSVDYGIAQVWVHGEFGPVPVT